MAVRILSAARERLLEIWNYAEQTRGEKQADKYLQGVVESIERVERTPHLWRAVNSGNLREVNFVRYKHHFVFFRKLSKGTIAVISILHESMDIPSRLIEDSRRDELK